MNKKKILPLFLLFVFNSCIPTLRNLIGNHVIDRNYNPLPQSTPFYTEVPYQIEDGFITIKAKMNNIDKDYNFIFDTGATTMVSDSVAKELKLEYGKILVLKDANGSNVNGMTYMANLSIRELDIKNIRINSSTLDIFKKKCNHKFDGIIGANVLKQGYYYFDAFTRKLVITNQKDKLPLIKLQNTVALKRKMGQPYIYVKGNSNEWLLFDSGYANGNIMINNKSKLINHNQKPIKQIYYPLKAMVSEEIKLGSFFNQKIQLGNFISIMPVVKYENGDNNLIGNQLIQNNDVIIDVRNKKFYITPFQKQTANESIANINFVFKNNAIVVSKLAKNSSLQKMGININDTIVSINNKSLEGITNACDFDQFISQIAINKQNEIKIEIKIKKNNKIEKYTISKKQLYE